LLSEPFVAERNFADNARVVTALTSVSAHNRDISLVAVEAKSSAGDVWVCTAIVTVTRCLAIPFSHIAG
jgi:Tfp pilus assembly major pilin PilA